MRQTLKAAAEEKPTTIVAGILALVNALLYLVMEFGVTFTTGQVASIGLTVNATLALAVIVWDSKTHATKRPRV